MECNVSGIERSIRIVVGLILLTIGLFGGLAGWQSAFVDGLGAIALLTGAIGFCPAWKMLGVNTCGMKHSAKA